MLFSEETPGNGHGDSRGFEELRFHPNRILEPPILHSSILKRRVTGKQSNPPDRNSLVPVKTVAPFPNGNGPIR